MKKFLIACISFLQVSCKDRDASELVEKLSKEESLSKGLKLYAEIKEAGVDDITLMKVFSATTELKERAKLIDLAFTLERPVVLEMLADIRWSEMSSKQIDSLLMIERGEQITKIEERYGTKLILLITTESALRLRESKFMGSYRFVNFK